MFLEMMNSMTSLLREQQEYLKEALALLLDIYPTVQQLMDQTGRWKTLCSALPEQNEVLTKQQQELLSFAGPLIPEKEFEAGTNSLCRKEISGKEEAALQDMTREELLTALAGEKRATRILSTQKISLRQLIVRLNEENEMLLSLWEEAEKKYGNAKSAYDDLWNSYEQLKGQYETARRKIRDLQKEGLQPKP